MYEYVYLDVQELSKSRMTESLYEVSVTVARRGGLNTHRLFRSKLERVLLYKYRRAEKYRCVRENEI